ncbi:hypothetical protein NQ315_013221 [Exocentrus adspersus]|uniref:NHR domain-containing protein n=1 Tax=Exocentrus adspersus TaxID=1586481 RepID=A0AAV8VDM8_9CUCU|nr:hypothetical protein NQ315_013221 [Exocentrus adspersus]
MNERKIPRKDRKLSPKDVVCEKHFSNQFVIREIETSTYWVSTTRNELRHKDKVIQFFTPSLNWLNSNDRIGVLKTADGNIKIYINGDELPLNFPSFSDSVFTVFDLRGSCSEIAVRSHKAPLSPLNSVRLQDSLEIVLDQEQAPELVDLKDGVNEVQTDACLYTFHDNHGRNIELSENRMVARRLASYNQGVVVIQQPLQYNTVIEIVIEQLETHWQSSLMMGLTTGPLDRLNLPANALSMKSPCCVVANDWISINGIKSRSNYGQHLSSLVVGDTIGLMLTDTNCLKLLINGEGEEVRLRNESTRIEHVTVANTDCEKADLESCEKERFEPKLSLPIPAASTSSNNSTASSHCHSINSRSSCSYKDECKTFMKKLLLPDCGCGWQQRFLMPELTNFLTRTATAAASPAASQSDINKDGNILTDQIVLYFHRKNKGRVKWIEIGKR